MGEVYEAIQKSLHKRVAIKLIRREALDSPSRVRRFFAEARALARLRHPHIVGVHGIGRMADGRYFLVMDLVEGGTTLSSLIKAGAVPFDRAAGLVATVAEAIDHAHSRGVIHRDLKPSNVLSTREGQPHVTDFGLAKIFDATDPDHPQTTADTVLGTPHYMASEQADPARGPITPAHRRLRPGRPALLALDRQAAHPGRLAHRDSDPGRLARAGAVPSHAAWRHPAGTRAHRFELPGEKRRQPATTQPPPSPRHSAPGWPIRDQEEKDTPAVSPQDKAADSPGRSDHGWTSDQSWKTTLAGAMRTTVAAAGRLLVRSCATPRAGGERRCQCSWPS